MILKNGDELEIHVRRDGTRIGRIFRYTYDNARIEMTSKYIVTFVDNETKEFGKLPDSENGIRVHPRLDLTLFDPKTNLIVANLKPKVSWDVD